MKDLPDTGHKLPPRVPKSLYRYQAWDKRAGRHGRDILTERILFFSRLSRLNDPFEGRVPIRYDLLEGKEFEALMLEFARANEDMHSNDQVSRTDEELSDDVRVLCGANPMRSPVPEDRWTAIEAYCDDHDDNYGVLCLSAINNSLLEWSHYADKHRGYCVELDVVKLRHLLTSQYRADMRKMDTPKFWGPYPVQYVRDFPVLIPHASSVDEQFVARLTTKSQDWSYEAEYRCISIGGTHLRISFGEDLVSAVILGCAMKESHRKEIVQVVRDRHPAASVIQVVRARSSFSLHFEPVDF